MLKKIGITLIVNNAAVLLFYWFTTNGNRFPIFLPSTHIAPSLLLFPPLLFALLCCVAGIVLAVAPAECHKSQQKNLPTCAIVGITLIANTIVALFIDFYISFKVLELFYDRSLPLELDALVLGPALYLVAISGGVGLFLLACWAAFAIHKTVTDRQ